MENKPPGEDVEKVVAMPQPETTQDWSSLLMSLGETKDKALFVQLFKHFAPKIKAYIIRLGLVESTAEELMQETMASVWRKAHMYQKSKAAASTWIFTLARNQSIDWMRKQKYPEYSLDEWHEEADDSQDTCADMVLSSRMQASIDKLPELQAQAIYMSFYEGRSHSEIADRLGIPLGSVKSRIRLASEKLRVMWRDDV
ncbi:sigma-70 family RNA polymerase sigma factor [Neptuniibacter sp. QD48_11]|uniref:sigma-70 family RNA polymerase sigma factor n=1 Tax=unclassified Neptuniibacter TaxID=2630693 RepID=UPI0039F48C33